MKGRERGRELLGSKLPMGPEMERERERERGRKREMERERAREGVANLLSCITAAAAPEQEEASLTSPHSS